jgi:hypothetical protein
VRTDRGVHTTFYPPKYLFDELDRVGVSRGMTVRLRASEARTCDDHMSMRIEIEDSDKPAVVGEALPDGNATATPPTRSPHPTSL